MWMTDKVLKFLLEKTSTVYRNGLLIWLNNDKSSSSSAVPTYLVLNHLKCSYLFV